MITRREFMQVAGAVYASVGASSLSLPALAATQRVTMNDLLSFRTTGNVTLLHVTDMHAQLMPVQFREPSVNLGVGNMQGLPPHITGKDLINKYMLDAGSYNAYALSSDDFVALARAYGKVGGVDRLATLVKTIRAERPDNTLFLDGGDTWQGSYTSLITKGGDMVDVTNALGFDAMTSHWEFTYGTDVVNDNIAKLNFPFLANNIRDTEWEEAVFDSTAYFERGGVQIAVIGQAFPYTPVANPRYKIPEWSFGIREGAMQESVEAARAKGAQLVVVLSHNGFDVDRKMASQVQGIDVILTGHTHDALPDVEKVGKCLLVASGSHGKFLSRLDLDVDARGVKDYSYKIMPVLSDAIEPDREMSELVHSIRAPHAGVTDEVLGQTDSLLYRRGNFNGTFDDLICDALLERREADIALSPGFRWGASLLPGQDITGDDVFNMTAITYPAVYRNEMTGEVLKAILEDVADNIFNQDPYYQQGGDMVRVGGMGYTINPHAKVGNRISDMVFLKTGKPIQASKSYTVAGWASINENTEGPAVYDLVRDYIRNHKTVNVDRPNPVIIKNA